MHVADRVARIAEQFGGRECLVAERIHSLIDELGFRRGARLAREREVHVLHLHLISQLARQLGRRCKVLRRDAHFGTAAPHADLAVAIGVRIDIEAARFGLHAGRPLGLVDHLIGLTRQRCGDGARVCPFLLGAQRERDGIGRHFSHGLSIQRKHARMIRLRSGLCESSRHHCSPQNGCGQDRFHCVLPKKQCDASDWLLRASFITFVTISRREPAFTQDRASISL